MSATSKLCRPSASRTSPGAATVLISKPSPLRSRRRASITAGWSSAIRTRGMFKRRLISWSGSVSESGSLTRAPRGAQNPSLQKSFEQASGLLVEVGGRAVEDGGGLAPLVEDEHRRDARHRPEGRDPLVRAQHDVRLKLEPFGQLAHLRCGRLDRDGDDRHPLAVTTLDLAQPPERRTARRA